MTFQQSAQITWDQLSACQNVRVPVYDIDWRCVVMTGKMPIPRAFSETTVKRENIATPCPVGLSHRTFLLAGVSNTIAGVEIGKTRKIRLFKDLRAKALKPSKHERLRQKLPALHESVGD